jgi:hypothetical protein
VRNSHSDERRSQYRSFDDVSATPTCRFRSGRLPAGVSWKQVWALRRALAEGTYDVDARMEAILPILLHVVRRRRRHA